jgi:hypothetical protein
VKESESGRALPHSKTWRQFGWFRARRLFAHRQLNQETAVERIEPRIRPDKHG